MIGILGTGLSSVFAADEPPRRISISGTVYLEDDETFGDDECHYGVTDNDVVYGYQQVVINQDWSCGGEVLGTLYGVADLMPGGAIRYHGQVILREGTCGCLGDSIRAIKDFDQVILPETNAHVDPGNVSWDGGDDVHIQFRAYNSSL
ncbi:hypothetical protein SMC26_41770 [Actinomadura fulvescens]